MAEIIDITIDDLTKGSVINSEWQGTGVFDTLIAAVNKNIEIQYNKGRITGKDYAEAYVLALQTTLQQSVEFLLRRDLAEAQLADTLKGIELKEAQLAIAYVELVGKDKEVAKMGLDNVVKNAEAERLVDPNIVYTPKYEAGV